MIGIEFYEGVRDLVDKYISTAPGRDRTRRVVEAMASLSQISKMLGDAFLSKEWVNYDGEITKL